MLIDVYGVANYCLLGIRLTPKVVFHHDRFKLINMTVNVCFGWVLCGSLWAYTTNNSRNVKKKYQIWVIMVNSLSNYYKRCKNQSL